MNIRDAAVAEYNTEYDRLLTEFTLERKLAFDIDQWPDSDQSDWDNVVDGLSKKLSDAITEYNNTPLDEREDEDFYMIDVTVDTEDGPDYETIDIRKVTLEHLKDICSMFPKYNNYYFTKVANSL